MVRRYRLEIYDGNRWVKSVIVVLPPSFRAVPRGDTLPAVLIPTK